jgi:putative heme-binding domain-containing protein
LGTSGHGRATGLLLPIVKDSGADLELRRHATRAAAQLRNGAAAILELARAGRFDDQLKSAAAFSLNAAPWPEVSDEAAKLFPLPPTKNNAPLPPISKLISMPGSSQRGQEVFAKAGQCANCHVVNQQGKEVGPNLSEIASKLSRAALLESIVYPSAGISHNYETHNAVLTSGEIVNGIIVSQTADSVALKSKDAIVRTYPRDEIEQLVKSNVSIMPADLQTTMTVQDLLDVVEYLTTLKKP